MQSIHVLTFQLLPGVVFLLASIVHRIHEWNDRLLTLAQDRLPDHCLLKLELTSLGLILDSCKCQNLNRNRGNNFIAFQNLSPNPLRSERVISRTLRESRNQELCHQIESLWGSLLRPDLSI
jgi:hypothetical protein